MTAQKLASEDEKELILLLKAGDEAAFEKIEMTILLICLLFSATLLNFLKMGRVRNRLHRIINTLTFGKLCQMQELFKKYLNNKCSPEEVKLLLEQLDLEENKGLLGKLITRQLEADQDLTAINEKGRESILAEIYQTIRARINTEKKIESPVVPLRRRTKE